MSAADFAACLNHSQATGSTKLVLLGIAWHMSETWNDGAYPSTERLANYAGISTRQVTRCLNELQELGELDIDRHNGRSYGGAKTNRYWTLVDCPSDCDRSLWHRNISDLVSVDKINTPDTGDRNRRHLVTNSRHAGIQ